MANIPENIACGGFTFYNSFDSANLAKVEQARTSQLPERDGPDLESKSCKSSASEDTTAVDYEFNLWTRHDCFGTPYQNNNRTWFYFGIKAPVPGVCVKLNIINLNKQLKMFSQGMCPVFRIVPGHLHWERIRERPSYSLDQKSNDFTLSFRYYSPDNPKAITYFAFTYPFSYTDLQNYLRKIDARVSRRSATVADDIYYHRECAIKSLEGRRLDVLTISSYHNISLEREDRLKNMFPEKDEERPFKFWNKKVIFISARVHPGETPSSFVLNGFLNFLLNREDQIAINLRRLYVFKLIPMLNPDGVARGHYRMDTKGINLNRVYLNPSLKDHPTIYAARSLIRYYHYSYKQVEEEDTFVDNKSEINYEIERTSTISANSTFRNFIHDGATKLLQQVTLMTLNEKGEPEICKESVSPALSQEKKEIDHVSYGSGEGKNVSKEVERGEEESEKRKTTRPVMSADVDESPSGLFLYVDLHGHASKKGVFMYGNHFDDPEDTIACMLLPKLMSINNPNFHFTSCNFTERNMYLIDKRDGMSREGSGRVAVYKMTGLVHSYTLECNYNSGRLVNAIPARVRDGGAKAISHLFVPPKYSPAVFEAVGAALGPSILDLTNSNPNSRLPNSQYRSLRGVKSYLKLTYANNLSASLNKSSHKGNDRENAIQDSFFRKGLECKENCDSKLDVNDESVKKDSRQLKKLCRVRRSTSLFPVIKRIKGGNKKIRQVARRATTRPSDVENKDSSPTTSIRTGKCKPNDVKTFFKSAEYKQRSKKSSTTSNERQGTTIRAKECKYGRKKDLPEEEGTAKRQQGAKRPKVMSPDLGESSKKIRGKTSLSEALPSAKCLPPKGNFDRLKARKQTTAEAEHRRCKNDISQRVKKKNKTD